MFTACEVCVRLCHKLSRMNHGESKEGEASNTPQCRGHVRVSESWRGYPQSCIYWMKPQTLKKKNHSWLVYWSVCFTPSTHYNTGLDKPLPYNNYNVTITTNNNNNNNNKKYCSYWTLYTYVHPFILYVFMLLLIYGLHYNKLHKYWFIAGEKKHLWGRGWRVKALLKNTLKKVNVKTRQKTQVSKFLVVKGWRPHEPPKRLLKGAILLIRHTILLIVTPLQKSACYLPDETRLILNPNLFFLFRFYAKT